MNILFLSTWFPNPPDNGSKLRVYHLLRALAQAHKVTLLSFAFATAQPDEANDLHAICEKVQILPLDPFAFNRVGTLRTFLSPRPMVSRPVPAMRQLVSDVLITNTFDAAIASTEMMAGYALQAPAGTAKILEEHNSMTRWMRERYENASPPLHRARCWASWQKRRHHEARYYRHFDLVTMVSEQDRAATVATVGEGGPRVEVVPNGVDCAHNRPGLAVRQPNRLVFNGSLTYSANYDAMQWFLAQIHPHIQAQQPDISLTITGSVRGVNLAGLDLDETVTLTGFVDDVRIPVAEAAVCIAPIRQGGGTRLKILEAMALGTPVVATSKSAEGLNAQHGQHLLIADTPQAFAAAVVQLLNDEPLAARLAANARRLVKTHYDWSTITPRFLNLVEQVSQRA